jgi:hypothetical protein
MTMIYYRYLGEGADAGGTVVADIVQNECMTMIFSTLAKERTQVGLLSQISCRMITTVIRIALPAEMM